MQKKTRKDSLFIHRKPEDSPGFVLWAVSNQWQRNMQQALRPFGLTHVQFVLLASLRWLEETEGPPVQKRLADHACADEMMTSQVIRKLEKNGWLQRTRNAADGRAFTVSLTRSGTEILTAALHSVEEADSGFFKPVSERRKAFLKDLNSLKR